MTKGYTIELAYLYGLYCWPMMMTRTIVTKRVGITFKGTHWMWTQIVTTNHQHAAYYSCYADPWSQTSCKALLGLANQTLSFALSNETGFFWRNCTHGIGYSLLTLLAYFLHLLDQPCL